MPRQQAVAGPSSADFHARVRREHLRWLCLEHLNTARPERMSDIALLEILRAIYADADIKELRLHLDYLAMRDLVTIDGKKGVWLLKLTYQGVDVVEYTSPCPIGIGRPHSF